MKRVLSKSLKMLILTLMSTLILSASAAVYYSITMTPQVTVNALIVKFDSSDDTPSASAVNDAWTRLALKSYPNATLTYDKAVDINNTDSGFSHNVRLSHVSVSPDQTAAASNWTSVRFYLYAQNATLITSMNYTQAGNNWTVTPTQTSYYTVPQSQVWYLKVETLSPAAATVSQVLNIEITLDVQE